MTVSSSTTPTRSVTYDSRLIEDYLHVTEILVDSEKENPVAVIIPCHRIIRSDGSIGGYRWGVRRKQALLAREQASGV